MTRYHKPVLVDEVIANFKTILHIKNPTGDKVIVDATLGTAGHAIALAKAGFKVIGLEADESVLLLANERIAEEGLALTTKLTNFIHLKTVFNDLKTEKVDGFLFDLGVNTLQLTSASRGMSFDSPRARLDMRIAKIGPTGADLLKVLRYDQLVALFAQVIKIKEAKIIAARVVDKRKSKPFRRVADFTAILKGIVQKANLNDATLPFMALRIAVNSELANIRDGLPIAWELLNKGGAMAIISFHSSEAAEVESFAQKVKEDFKKTQVLGPILPSRREVQRNKSARSARLIILIKND